MIKTNYVDVYEQVIDEDPESKDHFEASLKDDQLNLFEEIEDKAYQDLTIKTRKAPMTQSGGAIRTQEKRPLSRKLVNSF